MKRLLVFATCAAACWFAPTRATATISVVNNYDCMTSGPTGVCSLVGHFTPTAGNALLVACDSLYGDMSLTSATDNLGGTYNLDKVNPSNNITSVNNASRFSIPSGITSITCNMSDSHDLWIKVVEVSGIGSLDQVTGTSGTGTTINPGSATTTAANEIIIGNGASYQNGTCTGDSGYTVLPIDNTMVGDGFCASVEYQIVSATGSFNAGWTVSSGQAWSANMVTYSASGGGATAHTMPAAVY